MDAQADAEVQLDTDRDTAYRPGAGQPRPDCGRRQVPGAGSGARSWSSSASWHVEYANANKVTLDKIIADLAGEGQETHRNQELAGLKAGADMLPKPPVEPPGVCAGR